MIRSQNVDEQAYHLQSHCIKVHALCKADMTSKMSMTQRARFALKAAKCGIWNSGSDLFVRTFLACRSTLKFQSGTEHRIYPGIVSAASAKRERSEAGECEGDPA